MNFSEEKQAEFDAFAAYYAIIAAKPYTSASRSLLNQLRSIAVGQYGNGAWQELVRNNRRQPVEQPERTVKMSGGSQRRNAPPQQGNAPQPGTPRWERLKAKGLLESKSAAHEVVAGGEYDAKQFYEAGGGNILMDTRKEEGTEQVKKKTKLSDSVLKTGIIEPENETWNDYIVPNNSINDLMADAAIKGAGELSAKELLEKYSRDLIFEKLLEMGQIADELSQKSDRQLANLLKREATK